MRPFLPSSPFRSLAFAAVLGASGAATLVGSPNAAVACGGCFAPPDNVTSVTSHRMVVAIHANESILWDQIRYSGNPADFSWVLPVWGDVRIELASEAFFDTLESQTSVRVNAPPVNFSCGMPSSGGIGCGASAAPQSAGGARNTDDAGVMVLNEMVVGPYETVTLRSTDAMSLNTWLTDHSYVITDAVRPIIQYYVDHGMDFVALRLRPGEGVQAMQPVRIRYATSNMVLPLRMVTAGVSEKVGITLWVFGNGRYEPANFGSGQVDPADVVWDWDNTTSNYRELFESRIEALGGRAWLTEYSNHSSSILTPRDPDAQNDWQLATGNQGLTITRLRTNLGANFLDADLQLQAATRDVTVSNVINATRSIGTSPGARCAEMVLFPGQGTYLRRPGRTLLGALASVLALLVTRRKPRKTDSSHTS